MSEMEKVAVAVLLWAVIVIILAAASGLMARQLAARVRADRIRGLVD